MAPFFHGERWAESMSSFVAVDHVIDLDVVPDPKALSPIVIFCSKFRSAVGVSLPRMYLQGDNIIGDSIDNFLGTLVADPIEAPVVSESSELRSPRGQKKKWVEKKPAGNVVSELYGPVVGGTRATSKAKASESPGPSLAAVSVRPCGCQDVRHTQGSELSGLARQSSPRGPAAAASQSSASAGTTSGPAPWQQAGYNRPDAHVVHVPNKGETFDRSVSSNVRYDRRVTDHKNYSGVYMDKKYTRDLEHAVNKCIPLLPSSRCHALVGLT